MIDISGNAIGDLGAKYLADVLSENTVNIVHSQFHLFLVE